MSLLDSASKGPAQRALVRLLRTSCNDDATAEATLRKSLAAASLKEVPRRGRDVFRFANEFVAPAIRGAVDPVLLRGLLDDLAREAEVDAPGSTREMPAKRRVPSTMPAPPEPEAPISIRARKPARFPTPDQAVGTREAARGARPPSLPSAPKSASPDDDLAKTRTLDRGAITHAPGRKKPSSPAIARRHTPPPKALPRRSQTPGPSTRRPGPTDPPSSRRAMPRTVPAKRARRPVASQKIAVALFDADRFARAGAARALVQAQFDVAPVDSLEELLKLAHGNEPLHAVVVDGDADGIEAALARLEAARPGIVVLALTRGARITIDSMLERNGIRNGGSLPRTTRGAELVERVRAMVYG